MRFDSLQDKVVVITGASSGIGKLAAESFIKEGAKVALAARSLEAMEQHIQDLNVDEKQAIAVQVDVSDYEQVQALIERVKAHFGHIDVWVNNAAISIYGTIEQLTRAEIDRIVDVNLKGQLYCTQQVMQVFDDQGYGNLVNVASALGKGSTPLQAIYTATKHGIVGFSSCVREELMARGKKNIAVSVILPSSMDTPLFTHAKSKLGVNPYPIPPIYDPMVTVKEIIKCAKNPKSEVVAGGGGKLMVFAYRFVPGLLEKYQGWRGVKSQLSDKPKPMEGNDNLFEPMPNAYSIRGSFGTTAEHLKAYPKAHPGKFALIVAVPIFLGLAFMRRRLI